MVDEEGPVDGADDDAQTGPSSILDAIRAQHQELSGDHHLDLEVPGYRGLLVIRYGVLPTQVLEGVAKHLRAEKKELRTLYAAVDTLIRACEGVFMRVEGELQSIDPSRGVPVLFERHLADLLGFDPQPDDARGVVLGVFPTEHAVHKVYVQLSRWMQDVTADVTEESLGEF